MNPIPATIADDLSSALWKRLLAGEQSSEIELARWRRDAKPLERVDPSAFFLIGALIAALEGKTDVVLRLAARVEQASMSAERWMNWSSLLMKLGLMRETYVLALKGWEKYPAHPLLLERIVTLADAFEDAPTLERALAVWQKLHPSEMHPLLAAHALDELVQSAPDSDIAALEALEILTGCLSSEGHFISPPKTPLLDEALKKVDA